MIRPTPEQTRSAPIDALLIAKMFSYEHDTDASSQLVGVLLKHCDPFSTTLQLAGWLRTAVDVALKHGAGADFGDTTIDSVLDRWLQQVRAEADQ